VEATCKKANDMGLKRVGLFGTKFTMQGGFYDEIFFPLGIEVFTPEQNDREYIHAKYMNELVKGIILDETREELINIAEKMKKSHEIQGLILGGTELPLVLNETGVHGIPFLDTTLIHVENIIEKLI
jgi:aspartate racemase